MASVHCISVQTCRFHSIPIHPLVYNKSVAFTFLQLKILFYILTEKKIFLSSANMHIRWKYSLLTRRRKINGIFQRKICLGFNRASVTPSFLTSHFQNQSHPACRHKLFSASKPSMVVVGKDEVGIFKELSRILYELEEVMQHQIPIVIFIFQSL